MRDEQLMCIAVSSFVSKGDLELVLAIMFCRAAWEEMIINGAGEVMKWERLNAAI